MTDAALAERIRQALPELASPIRPGEKVRVWIERAAQVCGVPAARLRGYWNHKIEAPRAAEYVAVMEAADRLIRRNAAIAQMQTEIDQRAASLRTQFQQLEAVDPLLARLAPLPPVAGPVVADAVRPVTRTSRRAA